MRVSPPPSVPDKTPDASNIVRFLSVIKSNADYERSLMGKGRFGGSSSAKKIAQTFWILYTLLIFGKRKRTSSRGKVVPITPKIKMEPGLSYLLPSDKPDIAFKLLMRELRQGATGLVITRLHPEQVKARFNVGASKINWLSRAFTKESVSPTNLGAVADGIEEFVGRATSPVVLLDGVEYLIVQNDLQKVVRFISMVADCIAIHKAKLVIPFNLQSVDESGRALLTRDLQVIQKED